MGLADRGSLQKRAKTSRNGTAQDLYTEHRSYPHQGQPQSYNFLLLSFTKDMQKTQFAKSVEARLQMAAQLHVK